MAQSLRTAARNVGSTLSNQARACLRDFRTAGCWDTGRKAMTFAMASSSACSRAISLRNARACFGVIEPAKAVIRMRRDTVAGVIGPMSSYGGSGGSACGDMAPCTRRESYGAVNFSRPLREVQSVRTPSAWGATLPGEGC